MPRPSPRSPVRPPSLEWEVWLVEGEQVRPLPVASPRATVGAGESAELRSSARGVAPKHVRLLLSPDGILEVEPLGGATALLNEVQLGGRSKVRSGDQLALGSALLVFASRTPVVPRDGRVRPPFELDPMRALWMSQSGARGGQLWLQGVALPRVLERLPVGGYCAEAGPSCWECLLPEMEPAALLALVEGAERWAHVAFPDEGMEPLAVVERSLDRLFGLAQVEPLAVSDPLLERAASLLERAPDGPWRVVGEEGAGKLTLVRSVHDRISPGSPFVLWSPWSGESFADAAARAGGGTLALRGVDGVPASGAASAPARVAVLARADAHGPGASVRVPALRDRRVELGALAEGLLGQLSRAVGRVTPTLSPSVRELLLGHDFPGNVRELRVAMGRALLATAGGEVRPEALPLAMRASPGSGAAAAGLRKTLAATEREVLLAALARTRWNVTKAAQVLALPRRTVVYRMSKLGLKRPTRD